MTLVQTITGLDEPRKIVDRVLGRGRRLSASADYGVRRKLHRPLPKVEKLQHRLALHNLQMDGVSVSKLDRLDLASNTDFRSDARKAVRELTALTPATAPPCEYPSGFSHCIPLNPSHIARHYPGLYMWGLDHELLDLVEGVIGTQIVYHGVIFRKEMVDGQTLGTRFWHLDAEDYDVTRISIYLTDVLQPSDGAFEYIPRLMTPTYADFPEGPIDDATMARVVPRWKWRQACGPAETVIFKVPSRVFHHGRVPRTPRIAASYYYTSDKPQDPALAREYSFLPGLPHLRVSMTERQLNCLGEYRATLKG